ncbi:MAG: mannose-1-phosphate guanylyltransferase, partial [Verrucomicrobiota bacterium]|nr:mannose-1-phosphate guanylyltransferase [Verrucomicrobiota bacterium]
FQKAPFVSEILVATNALHQALVQEQLSKMGAQCSILIEPHRRNTAPAIALAVQQLGTDPQEPLLVVPSDHLIEPEEIFLNALEQLHPQDKIVTFGIRPTKPETGYGYIEMGKKRDSLTYFVKRFVEKPDLKTAKQYVGHSHFFWNSGMFLLTAETFWTQLKRHAEDIWTHFQRKDAVEAFSELPDRSIDYAIMEKSQDVLVCPLAMTWSDVGSWDSVYDVLAKDAHQNVKIGSVIAIDTTNSLIIGGKRIISTIGLDDLLIIETEEAVLISRKGESQKVKALLQQLKAGSAK